MIKLTRKHMHNLFVKSVINIEREEHLPFLDAFYMKNLHRMLKSNTLGLVYPKDIDNFLIQQQKDGSFEQFYSEFALIGRSNVGKSSIFNTLLQNQYAKVSREPGKTNLLHIIHLPQVDFSLVDCPGYGYAKRTKKEKNEWNTMMKKYITDSP